eukprot:9007249-Alexandrium_andersonii.AAC.1
MSASLVGSEMCIRDSFTEHLTRASESSDSAARPRTYTTDVPLSPAACAPVSYTHLTLPTICSV